MRLKRVVINYLMKFVFLFALLNIFSCSSYKTKEMCSIIELKRKEKIKIKKIIINDINNNKKELGINFNKIISICKRTATLNKKELIKGNFEYFEVKVKTNTKNFYIYYYFDENLRFLKSVIEMPPVF